MPDPLFQAALQISDDGARLELVGELDVSTAPELARFVDEILAARGDLDVDCSRLAFADSSGLDTLIRLAKALHEQGRGMVLSDVVPGVRRAIEVLRITDLVQLTESG